MPGFSQIILLIMLSASVVPWPARASIADLPPIRSDDAQRFAGLLEGYESVPGFPKGFSFSDLSVDQRTLRYRFEGPEGYCVFTVGEKAESSSTRIGELPLQAACTGISEKLAEQLTDAFVSHVGDAMPILASELREKWLADKDHGDTETPASKLPGEHKEKPLLPKAPLLPAVLLFSLAAILLHLFRTCRQSEIQDPRTLASIPIACVLLFLLTSISYPSATYVHPGHSFLTVEPISHHISTTWARLLSSSAVLLVLAFIWSWLRSIFPENRLSGVAIILAGISPPALSLAVLDPVYSLIPLLLLLSILGLTEKPANRWTALPQSILAIGAFSILTVGPHFALASAILLPATRLATTRSYFISKKPLLLRALTGTVLLACVLWWAAEILEPLRTASSFREVPALRHAVLLLYSNGLVVGITYPLFSFFLLAGILGTILRKSLIGIGASAAVILFVAATVAWNCWGRDGTGDAFPLAVLFSAPLLMVFSIGVAESFRTIVSSRILRIFALGSACFLFIHYYLLHRLFFY